MPAETHVIEFIGVDDRAGKPRASTGLLGGPRIEERAAVCNELGNSSRICKLVLISLRWKVQRLPCLQRQFSSLAKICKVHGPVLAKVLSMVIERATGQKVETLLEEKIWQPLKPEQDAVIVADSVGMPYLGAGMNACARDLARFGQMIVQGGQLNDNQIISQAWIEDLVEGNDDVRRLFAASDYTTMRPGGHYHNQFWGSAQDNQTLMCLGIHGQYIHMNLANQTVIVKLSSQPESANNEMFPNAFLALDALSDQL